MTRSVSKLFNKFYEEYPVPNFRHIVKNYPIEYILLEKDRSPNIVERDLESFIGKNNLVFNNDFFKLYIVK